MMSTRRAIAHMEMMDNTVGEHGVPDPQPYSAFVGTGVHFTPYVHSIVAAGEVKHPHVPASARVTRSTLA